MSYTPQNAWNNTPQTGLTTNPGPFLGEVMRNDDPLNSAMKFGVEHRGLCSKHA